MIVDVSEPFFYGSLREAFDSLVGGPEEARALLPLAKHLGIQRLRLVVIV